MQLLGSLAISGLPQITLPVPTTRVPHPIPCIHSSRSRLTCSKPVTRLAPFVSSSQAKTRAASSLSSRPKQTLTLIGERKLPSFSLNACSSSSISVQSLFSCRTFSHQTCSTPCLMKCLAYRGVHTSTGCRPLPDFGTLVSPGSPVMSGQTGSSGTSESSPLSVNLASTCSTLSLAFSRAGRVLQMMTVDSKQLRYQVRVLLLDVSVGEWCQHLPATLVTFWQGRCFSWGGFVRSDVFAGDLLASHAFVGASFVLVVVFDGGVEDGPCSIGTRILWLDDEAAVLLDDLEVGSIDGNSDVTHLVLQYDPVLLVLLAEDHVLSCGAMNRRWSKGPGG